MYVLGISAFYHDSAAALLKDGEVISAAQEERFSRIKHDANFPKKAIQFCIKDGKISPEDIALVVFYEKPFAKFERIFETYLAFAPRGFKSFARSMPVWVKDKLFQKETISKNLEETLSKSVKWKEKLLFSEHHLSHAASSFYLSPFKEAVVLCSDGVGEWETSSFFIGEGNSLKKQSEINFPHSLGLLYSAFTYYLGFKVNSGEYKVMGLAPYGKPVFSDLIKEKIVLIRDDGSFRLNMKFFDYCTGLKMVNKAFEKLFDYPRRVPETNLETFHCDVAASIQKVLEEIIIKQSEFIFSQTRQTNLCLAGGVALNCVANGVLRKKGIFKEIWVQPASGDAGAAIGAALVGWHLHLGKPRKFSSLIEDGMKGCLLGPRFTNKEVKKDLDNLNAKYTFYETNELIKIVCKYLNDKKAIGWMQGRMEFGPRALGNRSIIADARDPEMQKLLNLKVKFRESFRPFAPSILLEYKSEWFETAIESPYMLFVENVNKKKLSNLSKQEKTYKKLKEINLSRSEIPAVTHVDFSARVQTVDSNRNPTFYKLLEEYNELTGTPILINTSFNIRGEPIVCTPTDAFKCFMGTKIDILVIENFLLVKDNQDQNLWKSYLNSYELD